MSAVSLPLSVVLASGGMDSCVTATLAAKEGEIALLHADYGQRTEARERAAFETMADHFGVPSNRRQIADFRFFGKWGGSALTDNTIAVPNDGAALEADAGIPVTYVPFRNALFLSAAVGWAEIIGATSVHIGAVHEDSSGYPDCRPAFYEAFQKVVVTGTRPETRIAIRTPIIHMTKAEIVRTGLALGAPLHLSWSCYVAAERACGQCDSCRLRLKGFAEAGATDPIPYV